MTTVKITRLIPKIIFFLLVISVVALVVLYVFTAIGDKSRPPQYSGSTTGNGEETASDTDTPPVQSPEDSNLSPSEKARKRLSHLFDRDMNGETFLVATVDSLTVCPFGDSEDKVVLSRADCRAAVEEKYGLSVMPIVQTSKEIYESARNAVNSGMYYADILAIPNGDLGKFYTAGLLANMNSIPHTDYTADYYYGSITEAATLGNEIYGVFGAASFNPDYLPAVYFNKDIAAGAISEDLYDLVREGKWTFDKFAELNLTAETNNGNIFGHTSPFGKDIYLERAISAFGIDYVNNDFGSVPVVDFMEGDETENPVMIRANAAVDTLYKLFFTDNTFVDLPADSARSYFIDGAVLFSIDTLDFATWISDSQVNWGLLPMPKYDEASEYIAPLPKEAPIFCVLKNTPNYEASGLILEGLNVAAYDYTLETYIQDRIHYHLRDSDSIAMLRIICESPTADFTSMYASGFKNLDNATFKAVSGGITTRSTLNNLYRQYRYYANDSLEKGVTVYP